MEFKISKDFIAQIEQYISENREQELRKQLVAANPIRKVLRGCHVCSHDCCEANRCSAGQHHGALG